MIVCSGPSHLVSIPPPFFLYLSLRTRQNLTSEFDRQRTLLQCSCRLGLLSFCSGQSLSFLLSVFLWTYDMSYLLPSRPAPPPLAPPPPLSCSSSSSQLFLSDLWPHMTSCWPLGLLLLSCHLIFPCSSLVQTSGDPLLLLLLLSQSSSVCVLQFVHVHAACFAVTVSVCVCVFVILCVRVSVFQTWA